MLKVHVQQWSTYSGFWVRAKVSLWVCTTFLNKPAQREKKTNKQRALYTDWQS